jgi:putative nucleotidyltransferase with HDIG domain
MMEKDEKSWTAGHIVDYNLKEELEHAVYVSCLARDLAKEMQLSEQKQYDISLAGFLHDVGKLEVAEHMLEKEDEKPLIIEEMKYVRIHSTLSYQILKERGYPENILEAVRCHHENFDGTGYPDNLRGDKIPLAARIIRVCDVFAALTSDRPYRKHFEMEDALQLMIDESQHFDLGVFLNFQRMIHRVGTKYQYHFQEGVQDGTD